MNNDKLEYVAFAKEAVQSVGWEVVDAQIVGSTYIADNTKSDVDVLMLVKAPTVFNDPENPWRCVQHCPDLGCTTIPGWEYGGSHNEGNPDVWESFKRKHEDGTEVNALICTSEEYFSNWLTAAEVCRYLHLAEKTYFEKYGVGSVWEKGLRIGIHNILMDDSTAEDEIKRA